MLLTINHQTLIATKASRITRAAQGRTVLEFGSRRAQGYDGAIYGARAAYVGGLSGHGLRAGGPRLQDPRRRHDGALLGADV